ncbi:MAG: tRNA (guanosine(37)-N1)-methyltransferase TrmD [Crocinitomicaceae bacterium]|nr:tRNA (guanosine(37)-N1)-methyltransferase TrmD [Crocinitomicaceae bacterium]
MRIDVVSIFPDYLSPLRLSLMGKAIDDGIVELTVHDLRDYTHDKHHTVDDAPYGGGPGMVMKPEPWGDALDSIITDETVLVIPTPSGKPFTQQVAQEFADSKHLVFACGRYEGIDSRVAAHYANRIKVVEVSIGDYVLAGGEVAVLAMVEAAVRLVPGVLGNEESHQDDSFAPGKMQDLVEGPVFTRPPVWRELEVPAILTSGDHAKIAAWRIEQAKARTAENRPGLRP